MYNKPTPEKMAACIADAYTRLVEFGDDVEIYSWPQTWANTACGFDRPGTFSGQALTTAQTLIACDPYGNMVVVYHDLRFAYVVVDFNNLFWRHVENRRLLSAADFERNPAVYQRVRAEEVK